MANGEVITQTCKDTTCLTTWSAHLDGDPVRLVQCPTCKKGVISAEV